LTITIKDKKKKNPPLKKTKFSMRPLKAYRQERNLKSTQDNNNKSPVYNTRLEFSRQSCATWHI